MKHCHEGSYTLLALIILVFAIWTIPASNIIIIVASALLVLKTIFLHFGKKCCGDECAPIPKKAKPKKKK
ncbi:hypothetical protein HOD29_00735 [archaeon]|jgi:hypothetical protein|nr:hypothetical protein [archaeon]